MFRIGNDLVALVSDTACDLPEEVLAQYDIRLVSLRVVTSQGEFRDRMEINAGQVYEIMKAELKSLQKKFNVTMLFITHDQEEAFFLSDRIMVMCEGKISGYVSPEEATQEKIMELATQFMHKSEAVIEAISEVE